MQDPDLNIGSLVYSGETSSMNPGTKISFVGFLAGTYAGQNLSFVGNSLKVLNAY